MLTEPAVLCRERTQKDRFCGSKAEVATGQSEAKNAINVRKRECQLGGRKKLKDSRSIQSSECNGPAVRQWKQLKQIGPKEEEERPPRGKKEGANNLSLSRYEIGSPPNPRVLSQSSALFLPKSLRSAPVLTADRATCASGRPYGYANAMQCSESSLDSNLSFGRTRIAVVSNVTQRSVGSANEKRIDFVVWITQLFLSFLIKTLNGQVCRLTVTAGKTRTEE